MAKTYDSPIDAEALNEAVDRAVQVMIDQKSLAEDLARICADADEAGVASKREIRRLARERLMDPEVLHSQLERMATLREALGSFAATPLGDAAVKVAESEPPGSDRRAERPTPFARQTIHPPRRGPRAEPRRPRKPRPVLFDVEHPQGTA